MVLNDEINRLKFYLGGGSGLSLQLGHRISEDLDFFTAEDFQSAMLGRYLENRYQYKETLVSSGTLYCDINGVKLSFIRYKIPLIYSTMAFKKINVADWRDIMAEKFKTLSQRGSRKDFYDIYACYKLKKLNIKDGIFILKKRFEGTDINYYHILKSLVYFEDAENEPEVNLRQPVNWIEVKKFFQKNLKEFEKYLLSEN